MANALSDSAYAYIQRKLLQNEFSPETRISENSIARELGISRTPVREAIARLSHDGVLYQIPSKGTFVSRPSRQQILETFEVRLMMECFAASKAASNLPMPQIKELKNYVNLMREAAHDFRQSGESIIQGAPLKKFLEADMAFHLLILEAAENQMIFKIVMDSHVRSRVFGFGFCERNLNHISKVCLFHWRVAHAIQKRDSNLASQCMENHIRSSFDDALSLFDRHEIEKHQAETGKKQTNKSTRDNLINMNFLVQS